MIPGYETMAMYMEVELLYSDFVADGNAQTALKRFIESVTNLIYIT